MTDELTRLIFSEKVRRDISWVSLSEPERGTESSQIQLSNVCAGETKTQDTTKLIKAQEDSLSEAIWDEITTQSPEASQCISPASPPAPAGLAKGKLKYLYAYQTYEEAPLEILSS